MSYISLLKHSPTIAKAEACDRPKVESAQSGVLTSRHTSQHGAAMPPAKLVVGTEGTHGAAGAAARKAHYEATHSAAAQEMDKEHVVRFDRRLKRTGMHPDAAAWLHHWVAENASHNPHLLAFVREESTKEAEYERSRGAARAGEAAKGHEPRPAMPTKQHEQQQHSHFSGLPGGPTKYQAAKAMMKTAAQKLYPPSNLLHPR